MESGTRSLVRKVAAYRVLGWTLQQIGTALRTSKSNVSRILHTEECRVEMDRIHRERIGTLEAMLTSKGIVALRRLSKIGRDGEGDAVKAAANASILTAAVKGITHRASREEARPTANQVQFIRFADAVPPEEPSPEPPSSSEPSPS